MAMVVPYLLFGAVLAIKLLRRRPQGPGSIAPWAKPSEACKVAWWIRIGLWLLSALTAFLIPSPHGFSSVGDTFVWAFLTARWPALLVSGVFLALYAWAVHVLLDAAAAVVRDRQGEGQSPKAP